MYKKVELGKDGFVGMERRIAETWKQKEEFCNERR